jgi:hypothetical protein
MDRCILVYWKYFKIFFSKSLYFGIRDFFCCPQLFTKNNVKLYLR